MRRLVTSRLIWIYTFCLGSCVGLPDWKGQVFTIFTQNLNKSSVLSDNRNSYFLYTHHAKGLMEEKVLHSNKV